jgi:nucleoside-diphosphate-sugar epimerase
MNVEATKKLYELSIAVNVKKFFLLSSVAVYGKTSYTSSIGLDFPVAPKSAYGISKLDAENYLLNMVGDEAPKISILRLPLVIGKNAPGNLRLLEKLASLKLPLPFGCADNKRTVVSVEAVVDTLIDGCFNINSYQGLNLLGNDKPISTKQLIISLRKEVGLKPKLIPIPRLFMKFFLLVIGKKKIYEQLFEDLIFINSIENKNKNKNKNLNSNKN